MNPHAHIRSLPPEGGACPLRGGPSGGLMNPDTVVFWATTGLSVVTWLFA